MLTVDISVNNREQVGSVGIHNTGEIRWDGQLLMTRYEYLAETVDRRRHTGEVWHDRDAGAWRLMELVCAAVGGSVRAALGT